MVEMKKKNKEGKTIQKGVPEELVSIYENIGWEKAKKTDTKKETSSTNSNPISLTGSSSTSR